MKSLWRISAANRIKRESGSTNICLAYLCQQQVWRAFCKKISALNLLLLVCLVKVLLDEINSIYLEWCLDKEFLAFFCALTAVLFLNLVLIDIYFANIAIRASTQ